VSNPDPTEAIVTLYDTIGQIPAEVIEELGTKAPQFIRTITLITPTSSEADLLATHESLFAMLSPKLITRLESIADTTFRLTTVGPPRPDRPHPATGRLPSDQNQAAPLTPTVRKPALSNPRQANSAMSSAASELRNVAQGLPGAE